MNTNTNAPTRTNDKPTLDRTESLWVKDWLVSLGKTVPNGWMGVWKMTAEQVAKQYAVAVKDVEAAARGEKR